MWRSSKSCNASDATVDVGNSLTFVLHSRAWCLSFIFDCYHHYISCMMSIFKCDNHVKINCINECILIFVYKVQCKFNCAICISAYNTEWIMLSNWRDVRKYGWRMKMYQFYIYRIKLNFLKTCFYFLEFIGTCKESIFCNWQRIYNKFKHSERQVVNHKNNTV